MEEGKEKTLEERLWEASTLGDQEEIELLLSSPSPPDVNYRDPLKGRSPLFRASGHGHPKAVCQLLLAGGNVNELSKDLASPLFIASQEGKFDVVKILRRHPLVDVNQRNITGATALWQAAWKGEVHVVRELLHHPLIDHNVPHHEGTSALWIASQQGSFDVVSLILALPQKVDISMRWKNNQNDAIEQATSNGHFEIAELIRRYSENPILVRGALRKALLIDESFASETFCLIVFLCDDFLQTPPFSPISPLSTSSQMELEDPSSSLQTQRAIRFFNIASKLPPELQMILSRRAFSLSGALIKGPLIEASLRKIAFDLEIDALFCSKR